MSRRHLAIEDVIAERLNDLNLNRFASYAVTFRPGCVEVIQIGEVFSKAELPYEPTLFDVSVDEISDIRGLYELQVSEEKK